MSVRRVGGEELDVDDREDSSQWFELLFGVCGDRTGEERLTETASGEGEFVPNAIWSFCELRLNGLDLRF